MSKQTPPPAFVNPRAEYVVYGDLTVARRELLRAVQMAAHAGFPPQLVEEMTRIHAQLCQLLVQVRALPVSK